MHGNPGDIVTDSFHLAGVDPGSHFESVLLHQPADLLRTVDRSSRSVKSSEEPVPGGADLHAPIARQLTADDRVVCLEQIPPRLIS